MKTKITLVLVMLILVVSVALAQDQDTHTVSFDGFGFSYDPGLGSNVNIAHYPGDPAESAWPGFADAGKWQFTLYNLGETPDSIFDTGGIRVYRMDDIAQYEFLQAQVEQLVTLLEERPDLSRFEPSTGGLPYLPVLPHGQVLRARGQYVETEAVRGISYVAVVRADFGPFMNRDFFYTFQGISSDGQHYIAVTFPLTTELFPESLEGTDYDPAAFQAEWPTYLAESIATVNQATPDAFTPSLDLIDALVQSIHIER